MVQKITKDQEQLTPEQEKFCDEIAERYIANLHRGSEIDLPAVTPALEMIYGFFELELPEIEICDSPAAAIARAKELGVENPDFDWCGANDAGWLARYDVFYQCGVLTEEEAVDLKKMIALYFGGVYDMILCDERALIVRYPDKIELDREGNLHNPAGPAIHWRDGVAYYAWHGTWVPKEWIENPAGIPAETALTHQNIEQRRAAAEIMGWKRVLELLKPKVIDRDENPQFGELLEVELPDVGASRFLRVRCGTGRDFVLSVPLEMKTAVEANCWTYNITPEQLRASEVRT
jgi:hypothetical protein